LNEEHVKSKLPELRRVILETGYVYGTKKSSTSQSLDSSHLVRLEYVD